MRGWARDTARAEPVPPQGLTPPRMVWEGTQLLRSVAPMTRETSLGDRALNPGQRGAGDDRVVIQEVDLDHSPQGVDQGAHVVLVVVQVRRDSEGAPPQRHEDPPGLQLGFEGRQLEALGHAQAE